MDNQIWKSQGYYSKNRSIKHLKCVVESLKWFHGYFYCSINMWKLIILEGGKILREIKLYVLDTHGHWIHVEDARLQYQKKEKQAPDFFLSFFWSLWFGWGPPGDYPDVFGGLEVGELAAETGRAIWVSIAFPFEGFRSFVRASIYLSPALYRILQGLSSPSSAQHHGLLCPSRQNKQEETTQ